MGMVSVRTARERLVYHHAPLSDPDYVAHLKEAPLSSEHFLYFRDDPAEQKNLLDHASPEDLAAAELLRQKLIGWRAGLVAGSYLLSPEKVSPEVAAQLRLHGYWGQDTPEAPGAPSAAPRPPQPLPDVACTDRLEFLPPDRRP